MQGLFRLVKNSPFFSLNNLKGNNFSSLITSSSSLRCSNITNMNTLSLNTGLGSIIVRNMNRNARRPKKANHGKRPCSHARRREKLKHFSSVRFKKPIFGFFT